VKSKFIKPLVAFGRRFPATSLVIVVALATLGFGYAFLRPAASPISPTGEPTSVAATAVAVAPPPALTPPGSTASVAAAPSDIRRRVTDAETTLRTGRITATDDLGDGIRIVTTLRFDLGDGDRAPSAHIVGIYQGDADDQSLERIVIGDRAWQRQHDGGWQIIAMQRETRDQVRAFLPHVDLAPREMLFEATGQTVTLRWYDAAHDIEVEVKVDSVTGVPRQAKEQIRATGALLTVTYDAWNTDVIITPP